MIEPERLQQVTEIVRRAGLNDQTLAALRETFSDLHFTRCMDDDVGVSLPYQEMEGFNLYLVDGREHCLALTTDPALATGVLLAQVEPEV
jgi:hypothetical protein